VRFGIVVFLINLNEIIEILKKPEDMRKKSEKVQSRGFELQGQLGTI